MGRFVVLKAHLKLGSTKFLFFCVLKEFIQNIHGVDARVVNRPDCKSADVMSS